MSKKEIIIPIEELLISELTPEEKELVEAAKRIAIEAYAPYSKFRVGAAVRLQNGTIVTGSNQENVAYPSGLCAERTALFYAGAEYPDQPVVALAVTALREDDKYVAVAAPCGACRQVLVESAHRYQHPFPVYLAGPERVQVIADCRQLLPITFDASSL